MGDPETEKAHLDFLIDLSTATIAERSHDHQHPRLFTELLDVNPAEHGFSPALHVYDAHSIQNLL